MGGNISALTNRKNLTCTFLFAIYYLKKGEKSECENVLILCAIYCSQDYCVGWLHKLSHRQGLTFVTDLFLKYNIYNSLQII